MKNPHKCRLQRKGFNSSATTTSFKNKEKLQANYLMECLIETYIRTSDFKMSFHSTTKDNSKKLFNIRLASLRGVCNSQSEMGPFKQTGMTINLRKIYAKSFSIKMIKPTLEVWHHISRPLEKFGIHLSVISPLREIEEHEHEVAQTLLDNVGKCEKAVLDGASEQVREMQEMEKTMDHFEREKREEVTPLIDDAFQKCLTKEKLCHERHQLS
ncbi:hypothetical protein Lser_V15G27506 [Lactuca serriola]